MRHTAPSDTDGISENLERPAIRVLLVDDDPDVSGLFQVMLDQDERFSVVGQAQDGEEALRLADLSQPDVVVLDLYMPGMDGLRALPRLRARLPEARIVVVSAFPDPYTLLEAVERGADGYIDKSRAWCELIPALGSLCGAE